MARGRVESVNTSPGGVPKTSVLEALVGPLGLAGDSQGDARDHGGPDRAVSLFSLDVIRALQIEGHPIGVGTTGENLTISGLDWSSVTPHTEVVVGLVRLLITTFAAPCENIRLSFLKNDFTRISQKLHPGWSRLYARAVTTGIVRPGDPVELMKPGGVR